MKLKVVTLPNRNKVYIRLYIAPKTIYISTGLDIYGFSDGWFTKKTFNHELKNQTIKKMIAETEAKILENRLSGLPLIEGLKAPKEKKIKFSQLVKLCIEGQKKRISAKRLSRYQYMSDLVVSFGLDVYISDISPNWLGKIEEKLRIGRVNNTVIGRLSVIRAILTWATNQEFLAKNPFKKYKLPKGDAVMKDFLTLEEIKQMEEYADRTGCSILAWFLLSIYTGLRYSDLVGFDFSQKEYIKIKTQKTGSVVSIPISKPILRAMERAKKAGNIKANQYINRELKRICSELGIQKHIGFHTARHTFGFLCASLGIRPEIAQKWLGHSDIKTTMIYYHLHDAMFSAEMGKFNEL